jgi:hypothetical protein
VCQPEEEGERCFCTVVAFSTTDRIRLITQVITGIRVVKLLHWEPPYVPSHTALSVPSCDFAHFLVRAIYSN